MNKKIIVYVGNFAFPFGNASGKRVYGNGKLFRNLGYQTIFVGVDKTLSANTAFQDTKAEYDGFIYYNFPYPRSSREWINYKSVLREFLMWIQERKATIKAVICYGSPRVSIFVSGVIKWARKNNIDAYADCVDWLESRTGNLIYDISKTIDTYYQKAYANKLADGIICISTYLENYYKKANKKTVVIPPLTTNIPQEDVLHVSDIPVIVYAGSPMRKYIEVKVAGSLKDRIDKMIKIISIAKQEGAVFRFLYYGTTREEYLAAFPMHKAELDVLGNNIEFMGMQKNEIVLNKIKEADFTILIRDVKKATMAGFPTKVSESIGYGTPVITTRTSDIEGYLVDRETVLFVDQNDLNKSALMIKEVLKNNIRYEMKRVCQRNKIFHYDSFANCMRDFLN